MDSQSAHIEALRHRHHDLEAKINEEMQHRQPDTIKLQTLKKEKLQIKQELEL